MGIVWKRDVWKVIICGRRYAMEDACMIALNFCALSEDHKPSSTSPAMVL